MRSDIRVITLVLKLCSLRHNSLLQRYRKSADQMSPKSFSQLVPGFL